MKICYLSSARIPSESAHALQILHMCEAYALEGHEVTLLCPRWQDSHVNNDAYLFAGVQKTFKIVRLSRLDLFPGTSNAVLYWLRTVSFLLAARLYLIIHHFDLVVTRDYAALFLVHDCLYEIHTPPKVEIARVALLRRVRGLVVLTSGIKKFYTDRGVDPELIHIAPDAVDPERFQIPETKAEARSMLGLEPGAFIVGYVGSLKAVGQEKGLDTLIGAMRNMPQDAVAYVFGGEKDQIPEFRGRAERAGVESRVHFMGPVPHSQVPLVLRSFDCAVVPLLDIEVFRLYTSPLKVFEYMAAGLPMVVSDLPSLRDVLDERVAVFVPPGDTVAMQRALQRLREDQVSALSMANRARDVVQKKFTWQSRAREIVAFSQVLCKDFK